MTGIDEKFALLQMVRAHLCANRKNLIAKEQSEAAFFADMYPRAYALAA